MSEEAPKYAADKTEENDGSQPLTKPGKSRKKPLALLSVTIMLCVASSFYWWIDSKKHISTDNAFIEARIIPISSKVPGTVKNVLIHDNQQVKAGEALIELDDVDYKVQVAKAEAGMGLAQNETGADYLKAEGQGASVQTAKARYEQAELDLKRGEALYSREVIPKEQLDRLRTARRVAVYQLKEAEDGLKRFRSEAGLTGQGGNKAKLMQRKAMLDEARLQLSYTRLTAPAEGYITRKNVEPGANIQAGQPLMALVPLKGVWITANYKEGQLGRIKAGQKVSFTVDAYPGRKFSGKVESIMAGTGAAFSLLPPENATGNYVKVVQRVPVKIRIDENSDPEHLLRAGMSVIPTIHVD